MELDGNLVDATCVGLYEKITLQKQFGDKAIVPEFLQPVVR